MNRVFQLCFDAVLPHDLLDAPDGVGSTSLCLKKGTDIPGGSPDGRAAPARTSVGRGLAVSAAFALIDEVLAGGQSRSLTLIFTSPPTRTAVNIRSCSQQVVLHLAVVPHRLEKTCQLLFGQQVWRTMFPLGLFEFQLPPRLLVHVGEVFMAQSLPAGEADELGHDLGFRLPVGPRNASSSQALYLVLTFPATLLCMPRCPHLPPSLGDD